MAKRTISDDQLKAEIISLLESGKEEKENFWVLFSTKYKLGRNRYYKIFKSTYTGWSRLKDKAQGEVIIANTANGLKNGIKTKIERVLILQTQVNELLADLKNPKIKSQPTIKAYLRKTLRDIQSEISKIEGDYAPAVITNNITITDTTFE